MNLLIIFVAFVYLIIAQRLFRTWFKLFQRDTAMSLKESRLSWIILIFAAIFWLLVVPISYIVLLEKQLACHKINLEDEDVNAQKYYSTNRLAIVLVSIKG